MTGIRVILAVVALACAWPGAHAQMPVPHELLGRKRSTFKVPRTRAWDDENYKYFGGGPDLENECGGVGHCFHRPAVWSCPHYFVPPYHATWILRAEGLGFSRLGEEEQDILFRTTDDVGLFSMSDFDFDPEPAYRFSALHKLSHVSAVEFVYSRLHDAWDADGQIDSSNPIELRAAGIVINSPVDPFDLLYNTEFESAELNIRYYLNHHATSWFAGPRALEIEEVFFAGAASAPPGLNVKTKNRLLGGQIGIETQHWVNYGILRIDSCIKGGVYRNRSSQVSRLDPVRDRARERDVAWVGESELAANFPITRNTYLRVAYRLIHVSGIAVAADQINGTDLTVPVAVLNNEGNAIYHGWSVGLEASW